MVRLRRNVPSLGALAAFEAAARLGGFTKAANELGVTQAAISRQIRALETDLKVSLFVRMPRQVELTSAGRVLAAAVSDAFETMSGAIDTLRESNEPDVLTISSTLAFSHFWLLPRLPAFRAQHPAINIRVLSQDGPVDLRQADADVVIRYGTGPFRDGVELAQLPEEVFPVSSPDFVERHASCQNGAEELRTLPLIEAHSEGPDWMTWPQWFAQAGLPPVARQRMFVFSHYSDAVYAAITGQGVVLGWKRLLERPLHDGRLMRLGQTSVMPQKGHCLLVAADQPVKPAAKLFVEWLESRFNETE